MHNVLIKFLNVRVLSSMHYQPGEGPGRGLLRECEIFAKRALMLSPEPEYCGLRAAVTGARRMMTQQI